MKIKCKDCKYLKILHSEGMCEIIRERYSQWFSPVIDENQQNAPIICMYFKEKEEGNDNIKKLIRR